MKHICPYHLHYNFHNANASSRVILKDSPDIRRKNDQVTLLYFLSQELTYEFHRNTNHASDRSNDPWPIS